MFLPFSEAEVTLPPPSVARVKAGALSPTSRVMVFSPSRFVMPGLDPGISCRSSLGNRWPGRARAGRLWGWLRPDDLMVSRMHRSRLFLDQRLQRLETVGTG